MSDQDAPKKMDMYEYLGFGEDELKAMLTDVVDGTTPDQALTAIFKKLISTTGTRTVEAIAYTQCPYCRDAETANIHVEPKKLWVHTYKNPPPGVYGHWPCQAEGIRNGALRVGISVMADLITQKLPGSCPDREDVRGKFKEEGKADGQ